VSPYSQNFEGLTLADPSALSNDGWVVYGNAYSPTHTYLYGYGPFPAPNTGAAFCAIAAGQGGPEQGAQQLSVYSDYNNQDQAQGDWIESNVYHEQTVAAGDVGNRWTLQFDAKLGNLTGVSTAVAFIKTIDPAHGYALTNFLTVDMTNIPTTWGTYSLSIIVDPSLIGQLMQFGFANTTTNFEGSGVFYDNITWQQTGTIDVPDAARPAVLELRAPAPNPFARGTRLDYSVAQAGPVDLAVYNVAGRRVATLFHGETTAGPHAASWDGRAADGRRAPAGVYQCVLRTGAGSRFQNLVYIP
jgi:hypothetical protein